MKRAALLVLLAGCPSGNPKTLWLAPDQSETAVELIDHKPPDF